MSKVKERSVTNNKTGNKVTTRITRDGRNTHVERTLKKSDGLFGTRFLGTERTLTNKTIRRG